MDTTLIRNGLVVTMESGDPPRPDCDILIRGDIIADIGENLSAPEGATLIDARNRIVMPGLVNAHMHTWQTGLRGLAADWTIQQYLRAMHAGLATHFTADDIRIANLAGALNQISAGTTTLVDWCHNNPTPDHTDAAIDGLEESGIRAVFLHGSPKPDPKPGQPHFSEVPMPREEVLRLRRGRLSVDDALVTLGLAILGPGMSVDEVCAQDFALARELDLVASMHVSGAMLARHGFGQLAADGLLGPRINIVHANILDDETLRLVTGSGATVTVTAEVEMQMGFGFPLTGRLRALGCPVTIGSDIESAMTGDMFSVMRTTLQAQRFADSIETIRQTGKGPAVITIPCAEALRWATRDNAAMAGLSASVGSFAPGKKADLLLLDTDAPNLFPVHDPVASIVLQATPQNVDTVMIGGVIHKRHGRMLFQGLDALRERLGASGRRIMAAAMPTPQNDGELLPAH